MSDNISFFNNMSKRKKIVFLSVVCIIIFLSLFFGLFYGIKLTITLDYGYDNSNSSKFGFLEEGYRTVKADTIKITRGTHYSPHRPLRSEYTFQGWYKDSALTQPWVNGKDKVNSSITLYAKWEKLPA